MNFEIRLLTHKSRNNRRLELKEVFLEMFINVLCIEALVLPDDFVLGNTDR
jgi:hypothetical protein